MSSPVSLSCRKPMCRSSYPGTGKPPGIRPWPHRPVLASQSALEPHGSAGSGLTTRGPHRMATRRRRDLRVLPRGEAGGRTRAVRVAQGRRAVRHVRGAHDRRRLALRALRRRRDRALSGEERRPARGVPPASTAPPHRCRPQAVWRGLEIDSKRLPIVCQVGRIAEAFKRETAPTHWVRAVFRGCGGRI